LNTPLSFTPDSESLHSIREKIILIKIGGNALTDPQTKTNIAEQIAVIRSLGVKPVLVHGGGIEIKHLLEEVRIQSEFVAGHRKTDEQSIRYVEMALSGMVNKELVTLLHQKGVPSVGISGKDGAMVTAQRRFHTETLDGIEQETDIGFVGNVVAVDTSLVQTLLDGGYVPVISPISMDKDGQTYNINADMFAGHLAGALKAEKFIALTNINGLLEDLNNPESIIYNLTPAEAQSLFGTVIQSGMIPKIDACLIALDQGVASSHIINGTHREELLRILLTKDKLGTTIA
jgi:acetylglutamate kinase